MANPIQYFETQHAADILDIQADYFGKKFATSSADGTVKVWDATTTPPTLQSEITSQDGVVWQGKWGPYQFGYILATLNNDRTVGIWRENKQGSYVLHCKINDLGQSPLLSLAWAPFEYGCMLAITSADGKLYIRQIDLNEPNIFKGSVESIIMDGGLMSVCWSSSASASSLSTGILASKYTNNLYLPYLYLVVGTSDGEAKIYQYEASGNLKLVTTLLHLKNEKIWQVIWRPNAGLPSQLIAVLYENGKLILFQSNDVEFLQWKTLQSIQLPTSASSLSWNASGTILAAASEQTVHLLRELEDDSWVVQTDVRDDSISCA